MAKFIDPYDLYRIQGGASHSTHELFHAEQTKHINAADFVTGLIGVEDVFHGKPPPNLGEIMTETARVFAGKMSKSSDSSY